MRASMQASSARFLLPEKPMRIPYTPSHPSPNPVTRNPIHRPHPHSVRQSPAPSSLARATPLSISYHPSLPTPMASTPPIVSPPPELQPKPVSLDDRDSTARRTGSLRSGESSVNGVFGRWNDRGNDREEGGSVKYPAGGKRGLKPGGGLATRV